jgi:hypothetical protein
MVLQMEYEQKHSSVGEFLIHFATNFLCHDCQENEVLFKSFFKEQVTQLFLPVLLSISRELGTKLKCAQNPKSSLVRLQNWR